MFEISILLNFLVFFEGALRCTHVANAAQGLMDREPNNYFVLSIKSSNYILFQILLGYG